MNSLFVKIPKWVQRLFLKQIWSFKTDKKEIYLTFDDGPTPDITEWVLSQLEQYNAKATFFCIGKNIEKHADILKRIIAKKHSIGNHTHNHLQGWKTDSEKYINNVLETEEVLKKYNPQNKKLLFRPPYGKITNNQLRKVLSKGYTVIMWEVLSIDFDKNINKETCLNKELS